MMKRVGDLTHISWDELWNLGIFEFFNYLSFDIAYQKRMEDSIRQWKTTH